MRTRSLFQRLLAIAAATLVVACGDEPIPTQPTAPVPSEAASIEVMGQDSVIAGERVQFSANVRLADGTTKSATRMQNLRWRSSDPSVMSVTDSGVVFVSPSRFGETAEITAEMSSGGGVLQGSRQVLIKNKSVVTGELDISQQSGGFIFAFKLAESAGVSGTVTGVWIDFDEGWSGNCSFGPEQLGSPRFPARGTVVLDPLACGRVDWEPWTASVWVNLKDDNGYESSVFIYRSMR